MMVDGWVLRINHTVGGINLKEMYTSKGLIREPIRMILDCGFLLLKACWAPKEVIR